VNSEKQFNNQLKQIFFLLIILFLACIIIGGLRYFASSILGGFTMYMLLRKPHRRLREKKWKTIWATAVFIALSCVFFLIVVGGGLASILYGKLKNFQPQEIIDGLRYIQSIVIEKWNYNIFSENMLQKLIATVGNILPGILSATGNVFANIIMILFVLFFMLQQSDRFEKSMEDLLPISKKNIQSLKKKMHSMIISNAVGIPLIMFGQGITSGLAYWILDAGDPVIWGVLTALLGLIPVIGTGSIWLPLAINLIIGDHVWQGVVLIVYGSCVVFNIDSLVRIVFLKKRANVHPVITVFGVILGMNIFGFWGIIFGPLMISVFFLLLDIYKKEFISDETI
jgi:predicted PurR-regulated permease PerM